jgi:hypothetical protein
MPSLYHKSGYTAVLILFTNMVIYCDIMVGSRNSGAKRKGHCYVMTSKHIPTATSISSVARQWHSKHTPTSNKQAITRQCINMQ